MVRGVPGLLDANGTAAAAWLKQARRLGAGANADAFLDIHGDALAALLDSGGGGRAAAAQQQQQQQQQQRYGR